MEYQQVSIFAFALAAAICVAFLAAFVVVLVKIMNGTIDLSYLLSEPGSKASLSRFQFFLFTLVIGGLYLILSIENGYLIEVPPSTLGLLGISGGSYLISKGLQGQKGNATASSSTETVVSTKKEVGL